MKIRGEMALAIEVEPIVALLPESAVWRQNSYDPNSDYYGCQEEYARHLLNEFTEETEKWRKWSAEEYRDKRRLGTIAFLEDCLERCKKMEPILSSAILTMQGMDLSPVPGIPCERHQERSMLIYDISESEFTHMHAMNKFYIAALEWRLGKLKGEPS
jgi:hypothetical protein